MTYSEKLRDPRWQKRRLDILNRDAWTCRECQRKDRPLHVHHCYYISGRDPWEYEDSVFLTLCEECHETRQAVEHDVLLEFKRLLATQDLTSLNRVMVSILEAKIAAENGVTVIADLALDWTEDARWFRYAYGHPEARPFYEAVTGNKMSWSVK